MPKMAETPKPMRTKEKADPSETSTMDFKFTPVKKKPTRKYRKGSKYDPILDSFLESTDKLVTISLPDKDANYIRTQLNKRIEAVAKYKPIRISVVNNIAYLEKD